MREDDPKELIYTFGLKDLGSRTFIKESPIGRIGPITPKTEQDSTKSYFFQFSNIGKRKSFKYVFLFTKLNVSILNLTPSNIPLFILNKES